MAPTNKQQTQTQGSAWPQNPYGNKNRLEPDDFNGKPFYIVTIKSAEWVNMARAEDAEDGAQDLKLVLTYHEFGDKEHVINRTGYRVLTDKLPRPERGDEWLGLQIPLMVATTTDPRTGEQVEKVWVCSLKKWDQVMSKAKGKVK